jgi:acyl-CoA thioesterase FadM
MKEFVYTQRVAFGDCDPARIVWFPNFFRWIDSASRHCHPGLDPGSTVARQHGLRVKPAMTALVCRRREVAA